MQEGNLQQTALDPQLVIHLQSRNLNTAKDLFSRTPLDLVELLDLPYAVVENILAQTAQMVVPAPTTVSRISCCTHLKFSRRITHSNMYLYIKQALELYRKSQQEAAYIRTTLDPLDQAMHGGIPVGSITEVVGPASVGKSQLCMTMAVIGCIDRMNVNGKVLYIDTEHKFSAERVRQIAYERFPESFPTPNALSSLLEHVLIRKPQTSEHLLDTLQELETAIPLHKIQLIIIDSIAALARADYGGGTGDSIIERQRMLGQQASRLKYLAEAFRIPILVTNQVTAAMNRPGAAVAMAALGPMWAHAVNTRLVLASQRAPDGSNLRTLTLAKSPSSPNVSFAYQIAASGPLYLPGVVLPPVQPGSVLELLIANEATLYGGTDLS